MFLIVCLSIILTPMIYSLDKRLLVNDQQAMDHRVSQLEALVSQLNNLVHQQAQEIELLKTQSNSASTYVVWGRKQCPDSSTEMVYSGYSGGSWYGHSGAAAEYVCLPPDPNYNTTTYSGAYGRMYGGEYDTSFFVSGGDGNDVPCAVCRTRGASTVLMIPGKDQCYNGWKREYYGYLASHAYSFTASASYVCMHIDPQFVTGGGQNHEGKLFHPVVGFCGSLECPPYINNYPLTCVVCSK